MAAQKPSGYNGWIEPPSPANTSNPPIYPYNNVLIHDEAGNIIETDSTPNRERIRLSHKSGTFIEMHPDGGEVHKVYGNGYSITVNDRNVLIQGKCNITLEGDCNIEIFGDKTEYIHGNCEIHVGGSLTQTIDGYTTMISAQDMKLGSGGSETGALRIATGDHLMLNCDLVINGEITAEKITSQGRIDAFGGISAGEEGFVTELGGIAVGSTLAIPETIMCTGMISSDLMMTSPLGIWEISDSILHFDTVNNTIYDFHIHIAPPFGGPTSPPIPPMVSEAVP